MPVAARSCHPCRPGMIDPGAKQRRLHVHRADYQRYQRLSIHYMTPANWQRGSLAQVCWEVLTLPYHAAVRSGNTISCSSAAGR